MFGAKVEAWHYCWFYHSIYSWDNTSSGICLFPVLHLFVWVHLKLTVCKSFTTEIPAMGTLTKIHKRFSLSYNIQRILYWSYPIIYIFLKLSSINLMWSMNVFCLYHKTKKKIMSSLEKESLKIWLHCGMFFSLTFFCFIYISVSSSYKTVFKICKVLNLLQRPAVCPTVIFLN